MKISSHADQTEKRVGIRAEDIHKWIDGFFDEESFEHFLKTGSQNEFNPYNHRKYRHCAEALEDAYREFSDRYSKSDIKAIFECHIRDDYDGFIPLQEDFESGAFTEKYHENDEPLEHILSEAELSKYFKGSDYNNSKTKTLSPSFYWRIVWPIVIAALLFAASAFTVTVPLFRKNMMKQKREMIKELTSTAASAIEFYIHQEQTGKMPLKEAQRQAKNELKELRYGVRRKDYFWITDMHPHMLMHPYRPELVGKDLTHYTDQKDKSGKKLFVEFVNLVKDGGEGYLEYRWQWMDDPNRSEPKLSYVRLIPEWNWILGTGIYIHDVEEEISHLSKNLLLADSILSVALLGLMASVLLQSRRIERDRKRAEVGLHEAKDRYRALVESSNEGYVLAIDGETVYSNHTMQRLTGFNETELITQKIDALLDPRAKNNEFARNHFKQIYSQTATGSEFEARILTKKGLPIEVLISTSRIFFSEKNGYVISFVEIHRDQHHTLKAFSNTQTPAVLSSSDLQKKIEKCTSEGEVIQALKDLPNLIRHLTDQGIRPQLLRTLVGNIYDTALTQFINQSLDDLHHEPTPFAFISLGSNARHEMTLFSDQDNALIFADVPAADLIQQRRTLLTFTDNVCGKLKRAGYPYCPGGIMAANPKWCLCVSEWKNKFTEWIKQATPESILEINVFFDIRCVHGDEKLVHELRSHIKNLTQQNPAFFLHYAQNCLGYKAPIGLLGKIRTEKQGGEKTINLKTCIKPLETFARIYALKHHITSSETLTRLQELNEQKIIQDTTYHEIIYVFNYLWTLRFFNQITAHADLKTNPDDLNISTLTDVERDNLQAVIARIPHFQTKLSYDFLGTTASI